MRIIKHISFILLVFLFGCDSSDKVSNLSIDSLDKVSNLSNDSIVKNILTEKNDNHKEIHSEIFWRWINSSKENSFSIKLVTSEKSVKGFYCCTINKGEMIDCDFDEPSFTTDSLISDGEPRSFKSSYTNSEGRTKLSLIGDTLYWEVIEKPKGNFFCPMNAKLIREKDTVK